jgi:uncharacterized protein YndB with AHSA1/START domain
LAVDVLTEVTIRRPREDVAAFAANPDNAPIWYENIDSVQWRTDPPLRVGSEIEFVARFVGRRLAYVYRVEDFAPNERLVMRTAQGPFPMETTYTWSALDAASTKMTLRNRGGAGGMMRLFSPLEAIAVRRANRKDLERLRTILEHPGHP